ncbi:AAA family ATPase [Microbacterium azadirachtae]|uniref:ATP-dependent DNA helicase n=1 Tax=Microbacterium azadirachtae TaxID=582680 RepID=UPI0021D4904B|nr:AAA family ATPase [Microbacterium azadirachtae]UXW85102.1 AAA family ATPase [Microbacterium azadirachtae]
MNDYNLSHDQAGLIQEVLSEVGPVRNYLVQGRAGSGKTYTENALRELAARSGVTALSVAPTGLAASLVNGLTIHSAFGIQVKHTPARTGSRANRLVPWEHIDLLIVDEMSMIRADLIDAMDKTLRAVRRKPGLPFGGVQVVLFGDLFQLPPVVNRKEGDHVALARAGYKDRWMFNAKVWQESPLALRSLVQVHRQEGGRFRDTLLRMRSGKTTPEDVAWLNERVGEAPAGTVTITPYRNRAADLNIRGLSQIGGTVREYHARTWGDVEGADFPDVFERHLQLAAGARVIFTTNHREGLWQNGTLGTVTGAYDEGAEVRLDDGSVLWVERQEFEVTKGVWDEKTSSVQPVQVGSVTQVPLRLAWAMTIHKAQGQTFESAVIDFDRGAFDDGQAYVAFSRLRSEQGLYLARPVTSRDIRHSEVAYDFLRGHNSAMAQARRGWAA